jgi:Asp-tRNA(Asn)/Glu-tRNA(Gln) amidotransferase A subunit family amidase
MGPTPDFTLFKVAWFTQRLGSLEMEQEIHARHRALVEFLQHQGLTVREVLKPGDALTDESCLMRSDLTARGFALYQQAEQKWLQAMDKGRDFTDMRVFEKHLAKLGPL